MKQKLEQHRFKFFYTTAGPRSKGSVVVEAVSEEQAWLLFSDLDLDYTTVDSVLMIEEDSRQLNLFDSVGS